MESTDNKALAQIFCQPAIIQSRVLLKVAGVDGEDLEAIATCVREIIIQTQNSTKQDIQQLIQGQVIMLNALSGFFMNKALTGYENAEILRSMPQIPSELASLSLKCQSEMRKCAELLHEFKNFGTVPKIEKQLGENNAPVDERSEVEAGGSDSEVEAVGWINGSPNS